MITSAAQDHTSVALRPPFWDRSSMRFCAGLGALTLGLTIMAIIYQPGIDMIVFEATIATACICGLVVGAIRHHNSPIPKRNFLDMIRERLGVKELCYPFFRNCLLGDLRGEQGGWTTPDRFRRSGANMHAVGIKPVYLTDAPDMSAPCVMLITRNDTVWLAMTFGEEPEFSLPATFQTSGPTIFYVGHIGPARFDPELFRK